MTDIILMPLAIVLLLGWSPVVACIACIAWMLGILLCGLAWTGIVAAGAVIGRALRVR